jgi:hypothetical protein
MTQLVITRTTQSTNSSPNMTTATRPALAEITKRLCAEFHTRSREDISAAVHEADNDLASAPTGALPELVERLARQRLTDQLDSTSG